MRPFTHTRVRRFLQAMVLGAIVGSLTAAAALGDTSVSSNWSGYVVHRMGARFRSVQARWRQPSVSCSPGSQTYSAAWVGLGGFSQSSNALEQIGTEIDCSARGQAVTSVWYELVPGPTEPISLNARPGDSIAASVTVNGHRVSLRLTDLTRHKSFSRTVRAPSIDVSSADWIVEAPSDCAGANACQTLPLADFGGVSFTRAHAATAHRTGSITSGNWGVTAVILTSGGRRFVNGGVAEAAPSGLTAGGSTFTDRYLGTAFPATGAATQRQAAPQIVQLRH